MTGGPGVIARRGLGRGQIVLFVVLVGVIALTELIGIRSFTALSESASRRDVAQNTSGNIADAQRDALRLRLLLEQEGTAAEDALMQTEFLQRQLRQLQARDLPDDAAQDVAASRVAADQVAERLGDVLAAGGPARVQQAMVAEKPVLQADAETAEVGLRGMYGRFENSFYAGGAADMEQRRSDQALLLVTATLAVLLAGGLALSMRRVVAQDFGRALKRLVSEQEGRVAALEAVSLSERRFAALVRRGDDSMMVLDPDGSIVFATPSSARLLGLDDDADLTGNSFLDLLPPAARTAGAAALADALADDGEAVQADLQVTRQDGTPGWLAVSLSDFRDDPAVGGLVVNAHDVTDRAERAAWLEHLAFHDRVTGLPNRLAAERHLDAGLGAGTREVVVVLDLDGFGAVFDEHGQPGADEALTGVAGVLQQGFGPRALVAHFGNDVFAVVVPAGPGETVPVAARVAELLAAGVEVAGQHVPFTAGRGALVSSGVRGNDALRLAESAMHEAKRSGRGGLVVHDERRLEQMARRSELVEALQDAPGAGELRLHHQALVHLGTGLVTGTEALVRWQRPGGLVPPSDFVPLAEETGLIVDIGTWVIRQACRDLSVMDASGRTGIRVNVNVSARQLAEPGFVAHVAALLAETGTDASRLVLELTESAVVEDTGRVAVMLQELRAAGHTIALDDFGTGYSSFSHLMRLPVDTVKLDRSFIADVDTSARTRQMVRSVVEVCHDLGMSVTVEGIETQEQLAHVVEAGCDTAQGFLLARPMPLEKVLPRLTGPAVPVQLPR